MMRAAGALLLAIGILLWICEGERREKQRLAHAEGLLLLLRHMRTEIAAYATPLAEIYAGFSHPQLEEAGFLSLLRRKGLAEALAEYTPKLSLGMEEARLLRTFASHLGSGTREEECEACRYCAEALTQSYRRACEELPKRTKLRRTLSLTCGAGILLLFL